VDEDRPIHHRSIYEKLRDLKFGQGITIARSEWMARTPPTSTANSRKALRQIARAWMGLAKEAAGQERDGPPGLLLRAPTMITRQPTGHRALTSPNLGTATLP